VKTVLLNPGRDESLRRRHPWVFSGAIAPFEEPLPSGETVRIQTSDGSPLAVGAWSPRSQIRLRVWSFDPAEKIDAEFFHRRLERALAVRQMLFSARPDAALRLVNAESDGLPGVIVDRYGDFLVCQFLSSGAERWRSALVRELCRLTGTAGLYERSEGDARRKEGLENSCGLLNGTEPPPLVEIREDDLRFLVDVRRGHKTGFYLDQRVNRGYVKQFASGTEVLNAFAYTGGFGLQALRGGARRVTNIDTSAEALALADRQATLNGFGADAWENITGDVFTVLRRFRDSGRRFDLVVLDPPKFAASVRHAPRAARGYKDINLLALKLLRPGGVLFTFSCSGHIDTTLFQKIVADAALDAGREAQIIHRLVQSPDHPVAMNFPEAAYLKGLVLRVW
jgi:23S rRNA (cytosine1962-C5)-methyltransferase